MHSRSGSSTLRARAAALGLGLAVAATSATVVAQAPAAQALSPVDVTLVGINDFHGRLLAARDAGGAAKLATAVDSIRAEYGEENTIFAAAGDLIGASTFESFIQQDKPTIDVLNAAGLDVSAVGNHEFDQGYDDLVDRVMSPFDAETNPRGGAEWTYIGANVKMKDSGEDALEPTYVQTIGEGDSAVEVGFIGAVTEHLPELVSPAGIAELEVTDVVEAVNTEADALEADGVDLIVMLVHEGAPTTDCAAIGNLADDTDFGSIVQGVDSSVHAIISGHTHLAYDCMIAPADAPLQPRPVVSAGQYGLNINRLTFTVDADGQADPFLKVGDGSEIINVARTEDPFAEDPEVKAIVDAAVAVSDELGAEPLGEIAGPFTRAKAGNGTSENRGGESTIGNLVAEAQRWAADTQIGFINPGGLRADMLGENAEGYPAVLTYKQAAVVQPFANTLVKMDLTGEQLKSVLEEQWQPEGSSRPILHLGVSDGFEWSYDPTAAAGEHVTGMWLDEQPIEMEETYSVVANSFLASGGDNFSTLAEGSDPTDTGYADLQAMVDFMDEFASSQALPVDAEQRSIGATLPEGAPASYAPGDELEVELSSLIMAPTAGIDALVDDEVEVSVGGESLGTFAVDPTVAESANDDEAGKASVMATVPTYHGAPDGLMVTGMTTGTEILVPLAFEAQPEMAVVKAKRNPKGPLKAGKKKLKVTVKVKVDGEPASGKVVLSGAGVDKKVTLNKKGKAVTRVGPFDEKGVQVITVSYGDASDILRFKVR